MRPQNRALVGCKLRRGRWKGQLWEASPTEAVASQGSERGRRGRGALGLPCA